MAKSDYLENKVLDNRLGGPAFTKPATVYIALCTGAGPNDGGIANEVSTTNTGYARAAVTNDSTNWPAASGGLKANGTRITFPPALAAWGKVTFFAIMDASSGGNMLDYGAFVTSMDVDKGMVPSIPVGGLQVSET